MALVRLPSSVGVRMLPGSLTSERAKFWLSPRMTPSSKPFCSSAWDFLSAFGGKDVEGVNGLVLAVGAVDVDVEVGDEGAFDQGTGCEVAGQGVHVLVGEGFVLRENDGQLVQAAGFEEADSGAGAFADFVD